MAFVRAVFLTSGHQRVAPSMTTNNLGKSCGRGMGKDVAGSGKRQPGLSISVRNRYITPPRKYS
ncbi:MAG: hypothetical protein OXF25_04890, partial [Cyanobacteria bacterium MAG CAR3_bin_5]|nr:hypothetical protein [Cyanobacteria bacterium MAG CAR3_bin_5]